MPYASNSFTYRGAVAALTDEYFQLFIQLINCASNAPSSLRSQQPLRYYCFTLAAASARSNRIRYTTASLLRNYCETTAQLLRNYCFTTIAGPSARSSRIR
jgi:hypothetical protein